MTDPKCDVNPKYRVTKGSEIGETLRNQTKITDINQFCLEQIFIHLNLEDLMNVADANKCLRLAIYMPFIRNFGRKLIRIARGGYREYDADPLVSMEDITIVDLKTIFRMIRCFGGMITELIFTYTLNFNNDKFDNYDRIMSYLCEFSNISLKKLTIRFSESRFRGFNKPFLNVEYFELNSYPIEKCLSRLFPKLCYLRLTGWQDFNFSAVSEYFPNLYHLYIDSCFHWSESRMADFGTILQLNPNLRSLTLRISINECYYFDCIKEHLQCIQSLEIFSSDPRNATYINNDNPVYLQNVTKFSIWYHGKRLPPRFPLLFSKLKEFMYNSTCGWIDPFDPLPLFFNENRTIEKLQLGMFTNPHSLLIKADIFQETFPSLKVFICRWPIKDTKNLLPKYLSCIKYLESFSFLTGNTDDQIRACCANEWRVTRNFNSKFVTLQRIHANI